MIFQKLKHFPIRIKEFLVLAQNVIGSIPETRDIHKFLTDYVYLHLPRFSNYLEFRSLSESEMSTLGQGLVGLIPNASQSAPGRFVNKVRESNTEVVVCILDVTVEGDRERDGSDDDYLIEFGAAVAGEVFISDGTVDSRSLLAARCVSIHNDKVELGSTRLYSPHNLFVWICRRGQPDLLGLGQGWLGI
jgi:hypothetical protein